MIDNPVNPPSSQPPSGAQPPASEGTSSVKKGQVFARPMTFLGMQFTGDQAQKLWNILIQTLNSAIQRAQERAMKALAKLKKSETGDESSDD